MILDIYLNKESVPNGRKVILDNDSFFNKNVNYLENNEMEIIKPIDNFVYLGNNKIETPYGVCSIYELSTGSKTVINVMRNPDLVFNLDSCGRNALDIILEESVAKELDIKCILTSNIFTFRPDVNVLFKGEEVVKDRLHLKRLQVNDWRGI